MSNIDKPDDVAFAKAIAENLPGKTDSKHIWYGLVAASVAGKVLKNARNNK